MKFTISVVQCVVTVEADLSDYREEHVSSVANRAIELVRITLDLFSFKTGIATHVYFDKMTDPNGKEAVMMASKTPYILPCTAYELPELAEYFDLIAYEPNAFMALNDAIDSITTSRHATVNCARAIDGIRKAMSPSLSDRDRATSWKQMRDCLNLDEQYLQFISRMSTDSRHGDRGWVSAEEVEELISRTWKVLDRFLIYRKNGGIPLSKTQFSVLT